MLPFLCCRGRVTKVRPLYVIRADISTFRLGGGRGAVFSLGLLLVIIPLMTKEMIIKS